MAVKLKPPLKQAAERRARELGLSLDELVALVLAIYLADPRCLDEDEEAPRGPH
jgi:hypothetical protein